MSVVLDELEREILSRASRDAATDALKRLQISRSTSRWIAEGHLYAEADISSMLRDDKSIDDESLAERIAASVPNHVFDGWSYLGRSVHCLIRGDTRTAVHLGYYAELRSALALLASQGIGILNQDHFVIRDDDTVERLVYDKDTRRRSGTHKMVWPVYKWWTQQPQSVDLVSRVVRPGSQALGEWLSSSVYRRPYLERSTADWLEIWGFDLKQMDRDRGARNAASYGPSGIHDWSVIRESDAIGKIAVIWRLFEPLGSSRFDRLDRSLLRQVLISIFSGQTNRKYRSREWDREFSRFINAFLSQQPAHHAQGEERSYWNRFLKESNHDVLPEPFDWAGRKSKMTEEFFPLELVSRAAFHLRIATGACAEMLDFSNIGWEELSFWLMDVGTRRGIWGDGEYPEDPSELWTDIEEVVERISDGESYNTVALDGALKLEECERIGLWGLGNNVATAQ